MEATQHPPVVRQSPSPAAAIRSELTALSLEIRGAPLDPVRRHVHELLRSAIGEFSGGAKWLATTDASVVAEVVGSQCPVVINLAPLNDLRRINTFLRAVSGHLPEDGVYVCRMETLAQRWDRTFARYPAVLAALTYLLVFVFHRVIPRLPGIGRLYFAVTGGRNRVISEAEAMGRLVCCGFTILKSGALDGRLYIVARKRCETRPATNPSYGPIFHQERIGQCGARIRVFKLRTMHPYAEYLQDYVYEQNSLAEGGKFRNDFRVTGWGKFCRRYWLDELPMMVNWMRGDLKLVGVRPLSAHYESLYPVALRERRQKFKPGLIPPFYADLPRTFEEILSSEQHYLELYERTPLLTDAVYLTCAVRNILFRRARSA